MARYWSDEAYAQFHKHSSVEEDLAKKRVAGGGGDVGKELSRQQLESFQQAFAEWTEGRGGLREVHFRQFLMQLGVELSSAQARSLWQDVTLDERTQKIDYGQALTAFRQMLGVPLQFRSAAGALPPGKPLATPPDLVPAEEDHFGAPPLDRHPGKLQSLEEDEWQRRFPGRGNRDGGCSRRSERGHDVGLRIPVAEARSLLEAEGLAPRAAEALLQPHAGADGVPQAALFDILSQQAGALEA